MQPVFDADALLLLALVPASKRRPATLAEIVIALAAVRPELPGSVRLRDAFAHLSANGLMLKKDEGYMLSPAAEAMLAKLPKKGELAERIFELKQALAAYESAGDQPAVTLTTAEVADALKAWQASLPPLTKTERFAKRTGQPAPRGNTPRGPARRKRF
jgi:hypothetical protein